MVYQIYYFIYLLLIYLQIACNYNKSTYFSAKEWILLNTALLGDSFLTKAVASRKQTKKRSNVVLPPIELNKNFMNTIGKKNLISNATETQF